MSKIIKKQIKRTMPYFMILSLIMSSTVIGLVFNFNINTQKLVSNIFRPEVQANTDTATTSVVVRNAEPAFVGFPAEVFASGQGSTSTSPVNLGEGIGFSATATDPENNDFYLLVCATGGTPSSPVGGAAPSCNGGAGNLLCVSTSTPNNTQATCTYGSVVSVPETKEWYAFVCDNHLTQSDCSAVSQGSVPGVNATSSPMYVNHPPVFDAGATTVDNRPAGNNPFTFTATTSDADVLGGPDQIRYDVCTTNSWSTSTGCTVGTLCTGTTTITAGTAVVTCQATTTIPKVDQAYHYWGFVRDWHSLAASSGNAVDRTYTVINTAPVVSSVFVNDSNPITVSMKYSASTTVTVKGTISDDNSCSDLISASSSIYLSGVAGLQYCGPDNDNCYQIPTSDCSVDATTCGGIADLSATYTCTTTVAFNTSPTDDATNNSRSGIKWLGGMRALDNNDAFHVATTTVGAQVEVETLTAMNVIENGISYGTVKGNQNTGLYNATTTLVNYGNSPLNTDISGTDMGSIGIANQRYDLTPNTYLSLVNVASNVGVNLDIVAPKPTTGALDVIDGVYWGIQIPGGTPSGNYAGINSFVSTLDSSVSW